MTFTLAFSTGTISSTSFHWTMPKMSQKRTGTLMTGIRYATEIPDIRLTGHLCSNEDMSNAKSHSDF